MLHDVDTPEGRAAYDRRFDVCVIGAGPAGISLARKLASHGLQVALMEAGGLEWTEESQAVAAGISVGLTFPDLDIARLRWAVRAAARRVPFRAVCIEQSLCLLQMLRRRSVGAELHYGIGNGPGIELKAHVWLSVNGQVVLGGEAAEGFARVATFDI